jgi:hypothetical protein
MEDVNRVFIEDVIQNFKQVAAAVKANKEVFVPLVQHDMVKQAPVKGIADVGRGNAVFESGRLEDDVFVHRDSIAHCVEICKEGD